MLEDTFSHGVAQSKLKDTFDLRQTQRVDCLRQTAYKSNVPGHIIFYKITSHYVNKPIQIYWKFY